MEGPANIVPQLGEQAVPEFPPNNNQYNYTSGKELKIQQILDLYDGNGPSDISFLSDPYTNDDCPNGIENVNGMPENASDSSQLYDQQESIFFA